MELTGACSGNTGKFKEAKSGKPGAGKPSLGTPDNATRDSMCSEQTLRQNAAVATHLIVLSWWLTVKQDRSKESNFRSLQSKKSKLRDHDQ